MAKKGVSGNKHKYKGRNVGPARERYWSTHRLRDRKVKRLMRCCGLTRAKALALWESQRTRRMRGGARPSLLAA